MFKRTHLLLTLQYSALLLLLFALFSGGILVYMERVFGGDYVTETSAVAPDHTIKEAADAGLDRLRSILIISDAVVLVIVPVASYWLARRALKPVKKSYDMQQQFVDNASHELRTPLSVIQGELELALTKSRSQAEYQQAIATSVDEVSGLSRLVNNLLLIARNDPKQLEATYERVDVGALLVSLTEAARQQNKSKHIHLESNYKPTYINGARVLIERVLANVIDNALKFTGEQGEVTIVLNVDKTYVSIIIQDDGIGMTPQQLDNVFNRFWRADEARSIDGHGLGLSLVKQIMHLQGGKITITSKPTFGTIVTISFSR